MRAYEHKYHTGSVDPNVSRFTRRRRDPHCAKREKPAATRSDPFVPAAAPRLTSARNLPLSPDRSPAATLELTRRPQRVSHLERLSAEGRFCRRYPGCGAWTFAGPAPGAVGPGGGAPRSRLAQPWHGQHAERMALAVGRATRELDLRLSTTGIRPRTDERPAARGKLASRASAFARASGLESVIGWRRWDGQKWIRTWPAPDRPRPRERGLSRLARGRDATARSAEPAGVGDRGPGSEGLLSG